MKILAIGNSFSQDATYYLHQIAAADNVELQVVNLYIGGCSLERHWNNISNNSEEYAVEVNGCQTGNFTSIRKALKSDSWDYIVTQQASYDSGIEETYYPYIELIANYLTKEAPKAELLLQETWAYEIDSLHDQFCKYENNQKIMYDKVSSAYRSVSEKLDIRLIPCGDVVQKIRSIRPFVYQDGGMSICRDGFHMNIIYGRYLLAAVWYKFLTNNALAKNNFIPQTTLAPNAVCNENILMIIKQLVDSSIK